MPSSHALPPSTLVTEIPGRYCPTYITDKRAPSLMAADTTTSVSNLFLPRAESVDYSFQTPTTQVDEVGTNFHVGEYDDLPDAKLTITCYDGSYWPIALITGTRCPASSTTTIDFPAFNTAQVDVVRQFADPNGNVFASAYHGSMVIDEFGFSLKAKSVAMETYSLAGFNTMKFRGFIQTKSYVIQSGDLTAFGSGADLGKHGFHFGALLGTDEQVVAIPAPSGGQPASMWIQSGCLNFLKVERWQSATGWVRFPEVATVGALTTGTCFYDSTTQNLILSLSDMNSGDVWQMTYCTYKTDAVTLAGTNYNQIYSTTGDTSDPIAIPTRLTPFMISGNTIPRGQSLDCKISLKRERAEGIGDTLGIWGPSAPPEVSVSLEVKKTDFGLNAILDTGSPAGTDTTGTVKGDFYDPNWAVRYQLANAVTLEADLYDPRNAAAIVKKYQLPTIVLNSENETASNKSVVTVKYSGSDRTGDMTVSVIRP